MKKITKAELLAKLAGCRLNVDDAEVAHADADAALIAYINDPEITEAYASAPKWYA